MSLSEEILTLKTLVSTLLERVTQLEAENAELRRENNALCLENIELKSKLAKKSTNFHKPPSSEGYGKKPAFPKSTIKKAGGQVGHKGQTLQMVAKAEESIAHYAEICIGCSNKLSEFDAIKLGSSHQVFDLPPQKLFVSEPHGRPRSAICKSMPLWLSNQSNFTYWFIG